VKRLDRLSKYPARWTRAKTSRIFSARNQKSCIIHRFHLCLPSPRIFDAPFELPMR